MQCTRAEAKVGALQGQKGALSGLQGKVAGRAVRIAHQPYALYAGGGGHSKSK